MQTSAMIQTDQTPAETPRKRAVQRLRSRSRPQPRQFPSRQFAADDVSIHMDRLSRPALPIDDRRGLVLADPTLHPYRARGIGNDLGEFSRMAASDPIIAGSIGLIGREVSRAAWVLEQPVNPTSAESLAYDMGVKYLGLDGQQSWLRGGLSSLLRIMARNRTTFGFAPFERVWETKVWNDRPVMVPSRVYQIPPSSVWGWVWDDATGDLSGLLQDQPSVGIHRRPSPYSSILSASGLPDIAIMQDRLFLNSSGDIDQNPEGRSMVRPAWIWWNAKKDTLLRYQEGQEGLFNGVKILSEKADPKTGRPYASDSARDVEEFEDAVAQYNDGLLDFLYVPIGFDLSSEHPAISVPSPKNDLEYFDRQIALTFAAQLIGSPGASSMGASAAQMTFNSIDAIAQDIAEDINGRTDIQFSGLLNALWAANIPEASSPSFRPPKLVPVGIQFQDTKAWIDSLAKASQFMLTHYDPRSEQRIRARQGLPALTALEIEWRQKWAQERLENLTSAPVGTLPIADEERVSEDDTQAPILPPNQEDISDSDKA